MSIVLTASACALASVVMVSCVGDEPGTGAGDQLDAAGTDAITADTAVEDSGPTEAGGDAGPLAACDPSMDFDNPSPVSELNTSGLDARLRLTNDRLTAYWQSDRLSGDAGPFAGQTLFSATRGTPTGVFGSIAPVFPSNTTMSISGGTVSANNLVLLFTSTEAPGGFDIFTSSRPSTSTAFANVAAATALNTVDSDVNPYFLPDQTAVYFASDRDSPGTQHIYRSTDVNGAFSAPVELTELVTSGGESDVAVTPDELTIYFGTGTPGHIHVAHRAAKTDAFGASSELTVLNSATGESPTWISPDDCELYFYSARPGTGGDDLYRAVRKGAAK